MIKCLPERLKELRLERNLSQRQVAEQIGVSASVISGYENGDRTPSIETLLSLSYFYKCSIDYLVGKVPQKSVTCLDISSLSDKQINALHALIDSMKD